MGTFINRLSSENKQLCFVQRRKCLKLFKKEKDLRSNLQGFFIIKANIVSTAVVNYFSNHILTQIIGRPSYRLRENYKNYLVIDEIVSRGAIAPRVWKSLLIPALTAVQGLTSCW